MSPLNLSEALLNNIQIEFADRWDNVWGGKSIFRGQSPTVSSVRLDNNDYLGITNHPNVIAAQRASLDGATQQIVQSAIFAQKEDPSRVFELELAQFVGKEESVLCQSGYMANIGLLQAIALPDTPVYIDGLAHASLWEGIHAARAKHVLFRHNDPEHLDKTIAKNGAQGIVIVDSVYSTTGALCPLKEIVEVAEKHGCMIVVDESHALGTHGPMGRGVCYELGLSDRVHFITASLAKSFAGRAGFFTIPSAFRPYCLSKSFPNIFSSGLLPHEIAGLAATLPVVKAAQVQRERLHQMTQRLRRSLTELGYPIHQGTEQIIALEAGPESATIVLRAVLESHDIYGSVFCAPATSKNRSMVRCTLHANLSDDELSRIEWAAEKILPLVKPQEWPIARRAAR
jgi:CAI-1 autoinducer synthase